MKKRVATDGACSGFWRGGNVSARWLASERCTVTCPSEVVDTRVVTTRLWFGFVGCAVGGVGVWCGGCSLFAYPTRIVSVSWGGGMGRVDDMLKVGLFGSIWGDVTAFDRCESAQRPITARRCTDYLF